MGHLFEQKDNIDRIAEVLFLCPYALLFGVDNADWDSLMFILLFHNLYITFAVYLGFLWCIELPPPPKKNLNKIQILKNINIRINK